MIPHVFGDKSITVFRLIEQVYDQECMELNCV